jgi:hypothetical protein
MALEQRPAAEIEQHLRSLVRGTQPPADAGREYDRGNFSTVAQQWPFPVVASGANSVATA